MEQTTTATITGTSSWYGNCKYRLPCGFCELKKENCNWWQTISVPCSPTISSQLTSTPPLNPNMYEVTCNGK